MGKGFVVYQGVCSFMGEDRKFLEQLTRESVRLQRAQTALTMLTVILGLLGLFGAYLTQTPLVLLITAIAVTLAVMLVAVVSSSGSDESFWMQFWMQKVNAANKLRDLFLMYKQHHSEATPSMGQRYRGSLETAYGYAVVADKQSAVNYFKRLIDEYDLTLSRD
jgi:hypothetical protein